MRCSCGSILILAAGANPIDAYRSLFGEAFFDYYGFGATLVKFSPILLAGLAVAIPLQAGMFNVGAEGQIYMGALFCAIAALYLPEMYWPLHLLICVLASAAGGAFWAAIAGYLKAYRGINEVIVTLLLNYVGINIVSYAAGGPMMEEGAPYPYSREIPSSLFLPHIMPPTDAHIGAIIGVLVALILALALKYTTFGFAMTTVGSNPQAARYAGIGVQTADGRHHGAGRRACRPCRAASRSSASNIASSTCSAPAMASTASSLPSWPPPIRSWCRLPPCSSRA